VRAFRLLRVSGETSVQTETETARPTGESMRRPRLNRARSGHDRAQPPPAWMTCAARVVVLGVYVIALYSLPTGVFWHPDEGGKFLAMLSLRADNAQGYRLPYGGRGLDPQLDFYATRCQPQIVYPWLDPQGTLQFRWPLWFPRLSRPLYDAFGLRGLYVIPILCGWLIAVLAGRWAALYDAALVPVATLLVGVATPVLFYSVSFSEHTLATLCGVIAVACVLSSQRPAWHGLAGAAAALLAAVALRAELVALVPAVAFAALVPVPAPASAQAAAPAWRPTRRLLTGGLVAVVLGLVGLLALPAIVPPRYGALAQGLPALLAETVQKLPAVPRTVVSVFMEAPDRTVPGGGAGRMAAGLAIAAALGAGVFRGTGGRVMLLGSAFVVVELALYMALSNRPYLSRPGVLAVAPFLVVAPPLARFLRGRDDRRLTQLYVAGAAYAVFGFLALLVTWVTDQGDFPVGLDGSARYLLTLFPIAAVLALGTLSLFRRSTASGVAGSLLTVLVTAGVLVAAYYQYRGVQEMRSNREMLQQWAESLGRHERVLTDVWWLPASLAPFYASHEVYCLRSQRDLSTWLDRVAGQRVGSFAVATTDATIPAAVLVGGRPWTASGCETVAGLHVCRFVRSP